MNEIQVDLMFQVGNIENFKADSSVVVEKSSFKLHNNTDPYSCRGIVIGIIVTSTKA